MVYTHVRVIAAQHRERESGAKFSDPYIKPSNTCNCCLEYLYSAHRPARRFFLFCLCGPRLQFQFQWDHLSSVLPAFVPSHPFPADGAFG